MQTASDDEASRPLVSVVVCTFNQAPFLAEAIDSALAQTYRPLEVVVVDNASTDETPNVLTPFGDLTRLVRSDTNTGPSGARNLGAKEAKGDYLVFLDGDDRIDSDCVAHRVGRLLAEEGDLITGSIRIVERDGALIRVEPICRPLRTETTFEQAAVEMNCPTCGLAVRKSAFDAIGGFDETMRIAEDSDLLIRMAVNGRCLLDPEPLADYRQVGGSISRDYVLWFDSYRRMIGKNRQIAPNRKAYDRSTRMALRDRTCNMIFGKILKDGGSGGMRSALKTLSRRPILIGYLFYWFGRILANRTKRIFGRGPLAKPNTLL